MRGLETLLEKHLFLKDLNPEFLKLLAGCAFNKVANPGEIIAHQGNPANYFFIIREGKIAIQIHAPDRGPITLQTVSNNEVIGWSWLFPPYKWHFDIKAIEKTRMIGLDGKCLRQKCEENYELGYMLMKKFSEIMVERLKATRIQLLDIYRTSPPSKK